MKIQWSYSALKTFQTCPKQYLHKYVLKDVSDPGNEATRYGTEVHKAIEEYLRDGTPIPPAFQRFSSYVEPVKAWDGEHYVEHKMALGLDFKPLDFFDKTYFVRGVADFICVDGNRARILDWKTGKSARYADIKQLELMALLVFKHFPDVQSVSGGLVFLVADKVVRAQFKRENAKNMWANWLYEISRVETALNDDKFLPQPNNLCREYCPVKQCEFNGKRNY